jgi:hypothetical protein
VTLVAAACTVRWILRHADDRSSDSTDVIFAVIAAWSVMTYLAIAAAGITAGAAVKRSVVRATVVAAPRRLVRLARTLSALVSFCAAWCLHFDPEHGTLLVLLALLPAAAAGFLLARRAP